MFQEPPGRRRRPIDLQFVHHPSRTDDDARAGHLGRDPGVLPRRPGTCLCVFDRVVSVPVSRGRTSKRQSICVHALWTCMTSARLTAAAAAAAHDPLIIIITTTIPNSMWSWARPSCPRAWAGPPAAPPAPVSVAVPRLRVALAAAAAAAAASSSGGASGARR